jgi:MFS family permease
MTIAQWAEIITMAGILFWALPRIGIRWALAIGVIAWPLRYIIFAIGEPTSLVVASLALHGVGYTFFFVVSQIYVDKVAPVDIRASAQALLTLVTLGVGNFLGTLFTGYVMHVFETPTGHQWTPIFLVPCVLTIACAIAFLLFFKEDQPVDKLPGEPIVVGPGEGPEPPAG